MDAPTPQEQLLKLMADREVYIERQIRGAFAQVRAIDALTGIEVAVTTPSSAAQHDQNRLALRKLAHALFGVCATSETGDARTPEPITPLRTTAQGDGLESPSPRLPKGGIYT
jgi:hypothetical protein